MNENNNKKDNIKDREIDFSAALVAIQGGPDFSSLWEDTLKQKIDTHEENGKPTTLVVKNQPTVNTGVFIIKNNT